MGSVIQARLTKYRYCLGCGRMVPYEGTLSHTITHANFHGGDVEQYVSPCGPLQDEVYYLATDVDTVLRELGAA